MRVSLNAQFAVPSNKFQATSHKSPIPSSTPLYYLDLKERSLRFLTASALVRQCDRFVRNDTLTDGIQAGELLRQSSFQQMEIPRENLKVMVHCPIPEPMDRFF